MGVTLEPKLIQLIDRKAKNECPDMALLYSLTYIQQLNNHINGSHKLTRDEIKEKIDYLACYLTITLDHPLEDLEFLRARLCFSGNFKNINELSYIKNTNRNFPSLGRLNQTGKALFYASVVLKKDNSALQVILSESNAKDLDRFNVLRSHQKPNTSLNVRIIGIWERVRLNEKPYYLGANTFNYYVKAREYMDEKFEPKLLSAYELTDRFFADVLSRKGHEALYQVTSELASHFIGDKTDGILYLSVEAQGEPVVALVPSAVDKKIEHQFVSEFSIIKHYGYEFFLYKTNAKTTSIDSTTGKLNW